MSLFPDAYPPKPRPEGRRQTCCEMDVPDDEPWKLMHVLGHSRVPFSVAQVAEWCGLPIPGIRRIVNRAVAAEWIVRVYPEAYMTAPPDLYVGRLTKRR